MSTDKKLLIVQDLSGTVTDLFWVTDPVLEDFIVEHQLETPDDDDFANGVYLEAQGNEMRVIVLYTPIRATTKE